MKEIIAYVISYLKWIFAPENIRVNIFTLISVVLSGVVSWIISAIYFRFGNRNNLKSSVLYPMRTVLSDEPTWQRYKELTSLLKDHNARYLRKSERTTIDRLLSQYKDICRYDYEMVCAESLRSYFDYKLKKNGIDTKPVPVEIDGEIVDFDPPPDMLYFVDDMAKCIHNYPPEYEEERCSEAVLLFLKQYAKKCYCDEDTRFFDDVSLHEVLRNAKNRTEWDRKLSDYNEAKSNFLSMKALK